MAYRRTASTIITFYSYKGGTGRTMALANTACLLATKMQPTKPVLMMDWDLEAPGLHHFFRDWLVGKEPDSDADRLAFNLKPGLIEMMSAIFDALKHSTRDTTSDLGKALEMVRSVNPTQYPIKTNVENLFLLKAGVFNQGYPNRVNTFDWEGLFQRCPVLFSALAEYLSENYSYVLIDSRTGYTDTGGICTMLMPERLVAVFTPNRQSLSGIPNLVKEATKYRRESEDIRPLVVFPLPSRIENAEPKMKDAWRYGDDSENILGYQTLFERLFQDEYELSQCDMSTYFDEIQIQHVPRFSYGERVSVLSESGSERLSLTRSYEAFCERLTGRALPWEKPKLEADRLKKSVSELTVTLEKQLPRFLKDRDYKSAMEIILKLVDIGREEAEATGDFRKLAEYLRIMAYVSFRLNEIEQAIISAKESYLHHRVDGTASGLAAALDWLGFMSLYSAADWPPP